MNKILEGVWYDVEDRELSYEMKFMIDEYGRLQIHHHMGDMMTLRALLSKTKYKFHSDMFDYNSYYTTTIYIKETNENK